MTTPFFAIATLLFVSAMPLAIAQNDTAVAWRYDYGSACKEASEKHLPLLLFVTDIARDPWCAVFEERTLRNPRIAKTINEAYIPVLVETWKDAKFVEAFRIKAYPTTIFARPDGEIMEFFEGFRDVPQMQETLRNVSERH